MTKFCIVANLGLDIIYRVPRMPESHEKLDSEAMLVTGGGSAANVAHWLARLGHEVHYYSVTGADPLSDVAVQSLARVGVDVLGVSRYPDIGPSIASIFTHDNHKRMVFGGPRDTAPYWAKLVEDLDFAAYDHVHTGPELHPLLFAKGRRPDLVGRPVSADLNGQYSPRIVADLDFCFSNHDELVHYAGIAGIDGLVDTDLAGATYHLVVTRAAEEVSCYRPDGVMRVVPQQMAATDRTGGGDAFCAGYLHATWLGYGPEDAIGAGLAMAAATLAGLSSRPATVETDAAIAALTAPGKCAGLIRVADRAGPVVHSVWAHGQRML